MKQLLIYVEDPGGANCLAGLTQQLRVCGIAARIVADHAGLSWLRGLSEPTEEIQGRSSQEVLGNAEAYLFGTSENRETFGFDLLDAAYHAGLPVAAYVDARMNFSERFEGTSDSGMRHLPPTLFVFHRETYDLARAAGLPQHAIHLCQHPGFARIRERHRSTNPSMAQAERQRILPRAGAGKPLIVFAAELSEGLQAEISVGPDYTLHGFSGAGGRTEIVIEEMLAALAPYRADCNIVLRLHPKQTADSLAEYHSRFDAVSHGGDATGLILAADGIIGISSTLLDEALAVGKPVLSIVPRVVEQSWLMAPPPGRLHLASERTELQTAMAEFMTTLLNYTRPDPVAQAGGLVPTEAQASFSDAIADWLKLHAAATGAVGH
jgi:hypothetical protein